MSITIEKVTINDAKALLEIYAPYVRDTAISFEYEIPSIEEFSERIKQISDKYPYIKAIENGKIVGYAYATSFKGRKAYDYSVETTIYIHSDYKKMGIGSLLYQKLEESLKGMGIRNMNACIASPSRDDIENKDEHLNDASFFFHEKMGFTLVGRFHNSGYKFNHWYDMIWMEKEIGEHTTNLETVRFGLWEI